MATTHPESESQENAGQPQPQYEFGAAENHLFADLAGKMLFVGAFFSVIGVLAVMVGVVSLSRTLLDPVTLSIMLSGLLHLAIGVWTRSSGAEFARIVKTEGADISHLVRALGNLRKLYGLMYWIAILTIVLLAVALLGSLLFEPAPLEASVLAIPM